MKIRSHLPFVLILAVCLSSVLALAIEAQEAGVKGAYVVVQELEYDESVVSGSPQDFRSSVNLDYTVEITFTPAFTIYLPGVLNESFPNGASKIVFISNRDVLSNIYVMNADGSEQTNLTNNSVGNFGDFSPAWSPDGMRIAFMSDRDGAGLPGGNGFEIYVMNADGSGVTRLTDNESVDQSPSWSPDGTQIAFASNRDTTDGSFRIHVMNDDGSEQVRLTNESANSPSWSPNGSQIAFLSNRDGNNEIYVMNADGTGVTRLTNNAASDVSPNWSPDGSRITFASDRDGDFEIYVINANGTGITQLTSNTTSDGNPDWSPNGMQITFSSDRDGNYEIYVMNADGSEQTRLTNNTASDTQPNWWIALVRTRS